MSWLDVLQYIISPIIGGLIGFLSTYFIFLITKKSENNWKETLKLNLESRHNNEHLLKLYFQKYFINFVNECTINQNHFWKKINKLYIKLYNLQMEIWNLNPEYIYKEFKIHLLLELRPNFVESYNLFEYSINKTQNYKLTPSIFIKQLEVFNLEYSFGIRNENTNTYIKYPDLFHLSAIKILQNKNWKSPKILMKSTKKYLTKINKLLKNNKDIKQNYIKICIEFKSPI
ncbi:hypothetical protein [Spiroplasma taiwanense]|uniref:Transmembrane protein n=1 Tax=Spiroplasma taiwanense CT-1 TaxID=1276220 RepID=S5LTR0_9MOLU|nr:hypothetical protein [Spiroplasma taiwanense]AGR41099.1 hypothetical protein STAIW_v1c04530 [Spiroplasma taiwanense CT-1]